LTFDQDTAAQQPRPETSPVGNVIRLNTTSQTVLETTQTSVMPRHMYIIIPYKQTRLDGRSIRIQWHVQDKLGSTIIIYHKN